VGSFKLTHHRIFDLGGNVWEWCEDWYDEDRKDRVLRGASWDDSDRVNLQSSHRAHKPQAFRHSSMGLRCVLDLSTARPSAPETSRISPTPTAVAPSPTPAVTAAAGSPNPVSPPSAPVPKTGAQKWLDEIDAKFGEPYEREVVKPYQAGIAQLKQRYLSNIDSFLTTATQRAKLEEAIALRAERQRVSEGAGIPPDDSDGPIPSIKLLRSEYRAQAPKIERARAQAARAHFDPYDQYLAAGQAQLTQQQRLDEALLVKSRREQIKTDWLSNAPALMTATKETPFVSSLGMKFVPVPIVGGPTGGQRVLFSIWDTRVQDYEVFARETKREWPKADYPQGPTHPAVFVSWEDAKLFCEWLTTRDQAPGRLPANWRYRLPSDHEWSCAAGLGETENAAKLPADKHLKIDGAFPWGSAWPPPSGAGNYAGEELRPALAAGQYTEIKEVIAGYNDGFIATSPVGSFKANRFGLFDMGGNVWQWCEDWFNQDQANRVVRGASWSLSDRPHLLSSYRGQWTPAIRHRINGFRCVLSVSAR
jgi:formylglycine-generating enzyme required for sulfatase activity